MHHDIGDLFAVGDTMSWNIELIDGRAAGWPEHVLADVMVLEDFERTPRWLRTAKPDDAVSVVGEDGLLINLALTTNEIVPWD